MAARDDLPTYSELMYPTLRAVKALGGSARSREITDRVVEDEGFSDEQLSLVYDNRERQESVLVDRLNWARSYCKLSGALDSPRRGLFLLSELGQKLLDLEEPQARERLRDLDRQVRATRQRKPTPTATETAEEPPDIEEDESVGGEWRSDLLARLHKLPPEGFEEFVIYVLKTYGMELDRVGGTGDEGIDGIGTAPISPVLSTRVAVQAKRHDPDGRAISRDVVALFQRDAAAVGAERAVLVTLSRISEPARRAATQSTPNVELIDGDRLVELCRDQEIGIVIRPQVDHDWFRRFE